MLRVYIYKGLKVISSKKNLSLLLQLRAVSGYS